MNLKEMIKFLKEYGIDEKKLLIKAFIYLLISSILSVSYGMLVGYATENIINSNLSMGLIFLVSYFVLAILDICFFERNGTITMSIFCNNIINKISFKCFSKTLKLPALAFEEKSSGELITRINQDASNITDTLSQLIYVMLSLFSSLMVFIFIAFNSLILALEIIIFLIIMTIIIKYLLPIIKKKQKELSTLNDELVSNTSEAVKGIREIKAMGIVDSIISKTKVKMDNYYKKSLKYSKVDKNYNTLITSLSTILETSVFITCIILIHFDMVSIGFFIAMTYYVYRFNYAIQSIANLNKSYQKMLVSVERISEITENKLYEDCKYGFINKSDIEGNITFKHVDFKYKNEDKEIFKDLNLKIEANKITALVGSSGQGKSSIFNMILRFFDPIKGEILIDDIDIKDFTYKSLRENISVIRQEPFLFNKTIMENFLLINDNLTEDEVKNACKSALIDDYITSLKDGYNTLIGEGGVNLSGGQKQRLAIARALIKKSKIILFDEATSALDNKNQEKIKQAMVNLSKNHTIIVVAHRLSTIIDADIIHVIDEGKVKESGTHKQLLKKSTIYKSLYENEE